MKPMRFVQLLAVVLAMLLLVSCGNSIPDTQHSTSSTPTIDSTPAITSCSHHFVSVPEQAPTCTTDGFTAHEVCTLCYETTEYSILPGGHDYVTVPGKPATEMTAGYTEYRECSRCHETVGYTVLAATHKHSLTEHAEGETNPLFFHCPCGFSVVSELRSRPLIDQLTDTQYENFLLLYNMFKNREQSCTFTTSLTQAELTTFYYLLQSQCPELFLIEYENSSFALGSYGAVWNPDCISDARYEEVCQIMIQTMIEWDSCCAGLNEIETMQYIIRWLNENTTYSSIGTRVRSLYGGIIDREIACVGYSQIFAWAMAHFEIPCMSVNGYVPSRNDGHMWNLVKLDGNWYQVDPGWGRVDFNGTHYTHYAYLNVTDTELGVGSGRVYDSCYAECGLKIPACTSSDKNFARMDGSYLSSASGAASLFEAKLKNAIDKKEDVFTIVCSNASVMNALYSYAQNAGDVVNKHGIELCWIVPNHNDTTQLYFVSFLLARPNGTELSLEAPELTEGVGYKLALRQNKNGQTIFFSGNVTGKYLSTVADPSRATDVFYKQVEGGFRLWFMDGYMKKYVDVFVNDDGTVQAGISLFPTAVFNIDQATGAIIATLNGSTYWLGTYNNYSTIGASSVNYITGSNASNLHVSQFPAQLVTLGGVEPVKMNEPPIPVGTGTAYKLVMDQNNLGKKLYFEGWRTRNFPASTTIREKSPNIYLEASGDGYQLYYLWGDNKMYINVQGFGASGVSIQLQPTPGAPFRYNEELGIYTVEMYGEEYYIGCYGQYDTFSISHIRYITGTNAEKVGVTQFPAYLEPVD
ncbi:MAG: hypothetical protein J6D21_10435 [Clostridia bacterium]|nr:hypothetical protein [Clostridia bacterium]